MIQDFRNCDCDASKQLIKRLRKTFPVNGKRQKLPLVAKSNFFLNFNLQL